VTRQRLRPFPARQLPHLQGFISRSRDRALPVRCHCHPMNPVRVTVQGPWHTSAVQVPRARCVALGAGDGREDTGRRDIW
jgi:hypothetical protein